MKLPKIIFESEKVIQYLHKRELTQQYIHTKKQIIVGNIKGSKFGRKKPREDNVWYFRINKQYRALCVWDDSHNLRVFSIDNHQ